MINENTHQPNPAGTDSTTVQAATGVSDSASHQQDMHCQEAIGSAPSTLETRRRSWLARISELLGVSSLASLTRLFGAGLILFAVSLYLLQGVDTTNDLQRFLWLLAQTGLLGGAGLAVGYVLKEPRGARLFFFLGLLSIPANMAVIGAMIRSLMPSVQAQAGHLPAYINWQASSLFQVGLALSVAAVVLVPLAWFGMSVFARRSRRWLTTAYLTAAVPLLIPVRDSLPVFVMAAIMITLLLALLRNERARRDWPLTAEERFARSILFLSPVLLIARSTLLYSNDANLFVVLVAAIYLGLRQACTHCPKAKFLHQLLQLITALAATCLAIFLTNAVFSRAMAPVSGLLFVVILGGLLIELARVVPGNVMRWWMHTGWALCCLPAFVSSFLFWSGLMSMVSIAMICALMIGSARILENRVVLMLGLVSVAANLFLHGRHMGYLLFESNVLLLALIGAGIVIGGSVIERHGSGILQFVRGCVFNGKSSPFHREDGPEAAMAGHGTGLNSTAVPQKADSKGDRFAA